jgi:glycosyltransferase involved in cell wall biosynthesis
MAAANAEQHGNEKLRAPGALAIAIVNTMPQPGGLIPRTLIMDALATRFGGHTTAVVEIARRLPNAPGIDHVLVVTSQGSLVAEGLTGAPDVTVLGLPPGGRLELPRRILWEATRLPALAAEPGSIGVLSWSGMLPRRVASRLVCYPGNSLAFEGLGAANRIRRAALRRTANWASTLLVPSPSMGALIEAACGRRPELVPLGVDHDRLSPAPEPGDELLCVADFYRHKRQDLTLEIWAALPEPRPPLRLIGDSRVDAEFFESVATRAGELTAAGAGTVLVQDRLPFEELIPIYRQARVFLLPSVHESFCLPLLEAQACGVPCVTTDREVMNGTAGSGAVYIGAEEPAAVWAEEVRRLYADDAAHGELRDAAIANAALFSWEQTTAVMADHLVRPQN